MIITRSKVKSFKGRRFNPRAKVRVYRNLNRRGMRYSVMQGGRVVGHSQTLLLHGPKEDPLSGVKLIISEAGRKRCLETGVKNVHAYVEGYISYTELFFTTDRVQLTHRAGYLPKLGHFWVDYKTGWVDPFGDPETMRMRMTSALSVLLSVDGMSVDEPTTFEISSGKY